MYLYEYKLCSEICFHVLLVYFLVSYDFYLAFCLEMYYVKKEIRLQLVIDFSTEYFRQILEYVGLDFV